MKDTAMLTFIFMENEFTKKTRESVERLGYELINCFPPGRPNMNKHELLPLMYTKFLELRGEYKKIIYTDGADTFWLSRPTIPDDKIIWATERACYPLAELASLYPECDSPFKYLNGGNYCGPLELIIEYFEKYGLNVNNPDLDDQAMASKAFLAAVKDGFPIELDTQCEIFQTIGHCSQDQFRVFQRLYGAFIYNPITGTYPCCIHGNGRADMSWVYDLYKPEKMKIETLQDLIDHDKNSPEAQKEIIACLGDMLTANESLFNFRKYVRDNILGFGEDEFIPMWKLIIHELIRNNTGTIKFLEIGVFRGQILAVVRMIYDDYWANMDVDNYGELETNGVTPLDERGIGWESDYAKDIRDLHEKHGLSCDYAIIHGSSTDPAIISQAAAAGPYHALFIDGSHEYPDVASDLKHYLPMIVPGGYLVVDDCNNNMPFCYPGKFWGIADVSRAVDEALPPVTPNAEFEYLFSVVHNRVFRKR